MKAMPENLSVVTGANSGIGLEVAAGLLARGQHVTLACRSLQRCAAAKEELDSRRLPGSCHCQQLDLADYGSVRAFAADWERQHGRGRLAVLCNNAGVMGVPPTPDGSDAHLPSNVYGPWLLTRLLLPLMAQNGRVVNVGSEAQYRGSLSISGGEGPRPDAPSSSSGGSSSGGGSGSSGGGSSSGGSSGRRAPAAAVAVQPSNWYAAYARSKLCNMVSTAELARRLQARGSGVTAFCASPGRVATRIFDNVPGLLRAPLQALAALAFQTPQQGARTVLHAALAPEPGAAQSGSYLHNMRLKPAAAAARDPALGCDLWQLCMQEVGLSAAEDATLWPPH